MRYNTYQADDDVGALQVQTDVGDVGDDEDLRFCGFMKLGQRKCTLALALVSVQLERVDAMKLENLVCGL